MKIRITAEPGEQAKVERIADVLEKARAEDRDVELLIPALKDCHDRANHHAERIRKLMLAKMKRILAH